MLLVRRGSDEVTLKDLHRKAVCDAHQADRLTKDARECLKNLHRRAEAAYQSPIAIAIFFECFLSFLEQFKDGLGRI